MHSVTKNGKVCCSGHDPRLFCDECRTYALRAMEEQRRPMPTCNWEVVYAEQAADPNGNREWAANRKAEGSLSDTSGAWGSQYESGINPSHSEPQYHDPPKVRLSDGRARSQTLAEMLADLLEDEDDPDVAKIRRIVQRRIGGDTTPNSVYGGVPSYNTARDLLALNYAPSAVEYLTDVFPRGERLTENEKREPMPTPNWDAVYEEDSQRRDEQRPRG
jgi:hypothetical protein